ncbi:MAG TPA: response regulator [Arachidicoccus soli]|nr:response regulator [Arachidicoccus soli]
MKRPNILIIEDEEDIRLLYKTILNRNFDLNILEANSIHKAKELLATDVPSYVLLDLCLPDGSGCDIIPLLKSFNSEVKILVITAFGHCTETKQAEDLGAFGLLEKPFKTIAFIAELEKMLK